MKEIKVRIYPDLKNVMVIEVNTLSVKEVLETLKDVLKLQGQYVIVKNGKILGDEEYISNHDEITLVPVIEGG